MLNRMQMMVESSKNLVLRLIEPTESITDTYQRQQIRLINAIVLVFVPIAFFAGISYFILVPPDTAWIQDSAMVMVILSVVLLTATAWVGRQVGYWGATLLVFISGYLLIMVNAALDAPDHFDATYIILLTVLGVAVFRLRIVALIAIIEVVSVIFLLDFGSPINPINLTIFLIVSNLIILFTTYYRNSLENDRRQKLVESEAFLRLITDQLPVSVWITDKKLSRRATFGIIQAVEQVATIPTPKSLNAYRQALDGQSSQFEDSRNNVHFQYHIEPMRDESGEIIGTLGVATDITEQKKAQQQALQLELERERVDMLSKFVEHSSHDLRTPLSNINTYLYLLAQNVKTEKERGYIVILQEQSERLQNLIDNMLMLQRLELQTNYEFSEMSLASLLDGIHTAYQNRIEAQKIKFEYERLADNYIINIHEKHMFTALASLLDNAIQFTGEGGLIRIATTYCDGEVTISIQDTGVGIPEDQIPHIFEIFYRGDDSRSTASGDNGLGLTIVDRIIKTHDGKITVDSIVDEGTTFHITLPVIRNQALV